MAEYLTELRPESLSESNLEAALALADRCFPDHSDRTFLRSHWQRILQGQTTYFCRDDNIELTLLEHFLFYAQAKPVGFGGLYRHNDVPAKEWLNWFGVEPDCRGKGYGEQIVRCLASIAAGRGATALVGYTEESEQNLGTKRFYERLGFGAATTYNFRGQLVRLYELRL